MFLELHMIQTEQDLCFLVTPPPTPARGIIITLLPEMAANVLAFVAKYLLFCLDEPLTHAVGCEKLLKLIVVLPLSSCVTLFSGCF